LLSIKQREIGLFDVIFKRRLHEISGVGCTGAQHGLPNSRAMTETLAPDAFEHCRAIRCAVQMSSEQFPRRVTHRA
jgi:hypothetical protein